MKSKVKLILVGCETKSPFSLLVEMLKGDTVKDFVKNWFDWLHNTEASCLDNFILYSEETKSLSWNLIELHLGKSRR